jgi:TetR/AcrR family transcriptional repressor of nem operon
MDRYCQCVVGPNFSFLNQPGPALPALRQFVQMMTQAGLADPQRRGCLVANTVMELGPHERDIAGKLNRILKMGEDAIFSVLTRAKEQKELGSGKDPRALARFLVTVIQGTIVMIKAGVSADAVRQTVATALSVLD